MTDNRGTGSTCSAEIIGPHHLLTAAHCLEFREFGQTLKVLDPASEKYFRARIDKVVTHPLYKKGFHDAPTLQAAGADIAVVMLKSEINFTYQISPLITDEILRDLPDKPEALLVANGENEDHHSLENRPLEIVISNFTINSGQELLQPKLSYYAVTAQGGGPCEGDSGGGLFIRHRNQYYLAAIQSIKTASKECGMINTYGYAVPFNAILDWIIPLLK